MSTIAVARCTLRPPPGLGFSENFTKMDDYWTRCKNLADLRMPALPGVEEFDEIVFAQLLEAKAVPAFKEDEEESPELPPLPPLEEEEEEEDYADFYSEDLPPPPPPPASDEDDIHAPPPPDDDNINAPPPPPADDDDDNDIPTNVLPAAEA